MSAQKGGLYRENDKGETELVHQTAPRPPREPASEEPAPKSPKAKGKQPAVDGLTQNGNGVETL